MPWGRHSVPTQPCLARKPSICTLPAAGVTAVGAQEQHRHVDRHSMAAQRWPLGHAMQPVTETSKGPRRYPTSPGRTRSLCGCPPSAPADSSASGESASQDGTWRRPAARNMSMQQVWSFAWQQFRRCSHGCSCGGCGFTREERCTQTIKAAKGESGKDAPCWNALISSLGAAEDYPLVKLCFPVGPTSTCPFGSPKAGHSDSHGLGSTSPGRSMGAPSSLRK